jgi:hypothetical protein
MAKSVEMEGIRMSSTEAKDQLLVIQRARELQRRILDSRGGRFFASSAEELNELRDERSKSQ